MEPAITYRRIEDHDRSWLENFIEEYWGGKMIVVHGTSYYPYELDGYIAIDNEVKVGLITFIIEDFKCEIVTLDSLVKNRSIGKKLVQLVKNEAKENKCTEVWLITTNNNLNAIGFYQKVGFQLVEVFPNSVEQSRKIKPGIPLFGDNDIPIRDELKFSLRLSYE